MSINKNLSKQELNLKSAILAMVERLNEGVKRLELASDISASGLGSTGLDEMRLELANVAQVGALGPGEEIFCEILKGSKNYGFLKAELKMI